MRFSALRTISAILALTLVHLGPATAVRAAPAPAAGPACDVMIYEDGDFSGERREVTASTPYIGDHWSDRISSIRVLSGDWRFFKDSGFGGDDMLAYGPGDYPRIPENWNDRIRSLRCLDEAPGRSAPTPIDSAAPKAATPPASETRSAPDNAGGGEDFRSLGHEESFDSEYGPTPFYSGGRAYGWYGTGWHGPGFYVTGSRWSRGFGWGGREGWHGWHRSFWYRYRDRYRTAFHRGFDRHGGFGRDGAGDHRFRGGERFAVHGGFRDGFHSGGGHGGGHREEAADVVKLSPQVAERSISPGTATEWSARSGAAAASGSPVERLSHAAGLTLT